MVEPGATYHNTELDYDFKVLRVVDTETVAIEDQGESRIVNRLLMEMQIESGDLIKRETDAG